MKPISAEKPLANHGTRPASLTRFSLLVGVFGIALNGCVPAPVTARASKDLGQVSDSPFASRQVYINRIRLDDAVVQGLESRYRTRIADGKYWYDVHCGAWGMEGGPTAGFVPAGLALPGPMPADISGEGTGIFVNGREVHTQDQAAFNRICGYTIAGRYRLDHQGNLRSENGTFIVNLMPSSRYGSAQSDYGTTANDGQGGTMFTASGLNGDSVFWYSGM